MSDEQKKAGAPAAQQFSIDAIAQAFATAMKANTPTAGMLTGMSEERLARVRGEGAVPLDYRIIRGKSEDTGATFDMVILKAKGTRHGGISRIGNYQHPEAAYTPESQGGRCPDGQVIWRDNKVQGELSDGTPGHMLNTFFKQWRYETFWKVDLARFKNGLPLRAEHCVNPADLEAPWLTSKLHAEQAAE
jgi:hypothetical protein